MALVFRNVQCSHNRATETDELTNAAGHDVAKSENFIDFEGNNHLCYSHTETRTIKTVCVCMFVCIYKSLKQRHDIQLR